MVLQGEAGLKGPKGLLGRKGSQARGVRTGPSAGVPAAPLLR